MDTITHKESKKRFETKVDKHTAYVEYETDCQYIDITHTYVPEELEGKGIASRLVAATYEYGKSIGLHPKATCRYAKVWLEKNANKQK